MSYFAVQRFDRTPANGSVHVQTVSGLLEADHRAPSIDYDTLLKVITRSLLHVTSVMCDRCLSAWSSTSLRTIATITRKIMPS